MEARPFTQKEQQLLGLMVEALTIMAALLRDEPGRYDRVRSRADDLVQRRYRVSRAEINRLMEADPRWMSMEQVLAVRAWCEVVLQHKSR